MFTKRRFISLLAITWILGLQAEIISASDTPEPAPIVERELNFYDFTLKNNLGQNFNLREYAAGHRLTIVAFVAGWCQNSNQNGHVIKRLYDKYRERGLGVAVVAEYSDAEEVRIHINRIGIDYPVVIETKSRGDRKDSQHYKYRRAVGDKRKWGTPFYVIIPATSIEAAAPKAPLAKHVYTVSGEMIESEAEKFIEQQLNLPGQTKTQ